MKSPMRLRCLASRRCRTRRRRPEPPPRCVSRAASTPYVVSIAYTSFVLTLAQSTRSSLAHAAEKLTPSVCTERGFFPAGSSSGGFPMTNVLSMPGTERTTTAAATASAISSINRRGAPSRSERVSWHVLSSLSTRTESAMSSSDSIKSPRGPIVVAAFLGRLRPRPRLGLGVPLGGHVVLGIRLGGGHVVLGSRARVVVIRPSSSSEPSVRTTFALDVFASRAAFSFSVNPSPSSPRAPRRSSVLAPSSSSSASASASLSSSSPSSRFAAAAADFLLRSGAASASSSASSPSPPPLDPPPRVPSSRPAWIFPREAPRRRNSWRISPYIFLAKSRSNIPRHAREGNLPGVLPRGVSPPPPPRRPSRRRRPPRRSIREIVP